MTAPKDQSLVLAGFRAGWAAACLAISEDLQRAGATGCASSVRRAAHLPPSIEIGNVSDLQEDLSARGGEVVFVDQTGFTPKGGGK
jgi:hypothetical protein